MAIRDQPVEHCTPIAIGRAPFVRLVKLDTQPGALNPDPWEIWCVDLDSTLSEFRNDRPSLSTLAEHFKTTVATATKSGHGPACVIGAVRSMAATKPHLAEDFRRQVADLGIILHELELHHDLESFVTDLQDRLRQRYNGSLHPEAMTRPMFVRTAFDVYADHYYEAMDDMRDLIGQEPMYTIKRAYLFTRWKYRDLYRSLARGATAI